MDHIEPAHSSRVKGPGKCLLPRARLCNGHRDVPQGAFAQEEQPRRESRRGPTRSRSVQPEPQAFRAVLAHVLPSPSAPRAIRAFISSRKKGNRTLELIREAAPALGRKAL